MSLVNFRDAKGESLERCYEPIGTRSYDMIDLIVPSANDSERSRDFTVSSTPTQYGFLSERLIVPDRIAPNFLIRNVRVGNVSQITGPVPASLFAAFEANHLVIDPVERDIMFAVDLHYLGNDPIAEFQAAVVGKTRDGKRCILPLYAKVQIGYSNPFRSGIQALRYVSDIILPDS